MKTINVKYCNYGNTTEKTPRTYNYFIHNILSKYYDVNVSENPDYVFYHESAYEYLNYKCIRIFNTGENMTPNFNLCDYATGIDYMTFGDRYYRLPPFFVASLYTERDIELAKDIDLENPKQYTKGDVAKKTEFCSFVYSNYIADERRKILLDTINSYKKVNSGGKYLNNVGGPVPNKLEFELKHKFSMAIENSCRDGYTTDRILNSIMSGGIPIYWGNPSIGREFNTKRFINCHEYPSFEKVLERIIELDTNEEEYLRVLNQPVFAEGYSFKQVLDGLEVFLKNIFDQPLESAARRTINVARIKDVDNNEMIIARRARRNAEIKRILAALYQPLKRIKALETFKQWYFRKRYLDKKQSTV